MSKFIDKLTQSYRNLSPAIGFRSAAQDEDNRPILLIASLTGVSDNIIKGVVSSGVDAAVIDGDKLNATNMKTLMKNVGDIPIGLLLANTGTERIDEFINLGGDFIFFSPLVPVDTVNKEGIGKILIINPSMEPGIIRAINALDIPIDSVLIEGDEPTVTIERLLVYQFFASLLDKPLLAMANTTITSNELSGLHKAGVNGLILPKGFKSKAILELKEMIADLPKLAKKKSSGSAIIPKISGERKIDEDEDEDDDEYI